MVKMAWSRSDFFEIIIIIIIIIIFLIRLFKAFFVQHLRAEQYIGTASVYSRTQ